MHLRHDSFFCWLLIIRNCWFTSQRAGLYFFMNYLFFLNSYQMLDLMLKDLINTKLIWTFSWMTHTHSRCLFFFFFSLIHILCKHGIVIGFVWDLYSYIRWKQRRHCSDSSQSLILDNWHNSNSCQVYLIESTQNLDYCFNVSSLKQLTWCCSFFKIKNPAVLNCQKKKIICLLSSWFEGPASKIVWNL